jgi:hypothetical protein
LTLSGHVRGFHAWGVRTVLRPANAFLTANACAGMEARPSPGLAPVIAVCATLPSPRRFSILKQFSPKNFGLDPKNDCQDTWADSAYRSEEQEEKLKKQGCASHIHERAYRNKPLTPEQEAANTERSRVRVRIEHVFGHIETAMHGCYVRTIGIARARAKIGLEVLAYNMSRFTFLMHSSGIAASA